MDNEIIIRFAGGKKVSAEYKNFEIATDQPVKYGGEETAPEPFALFLASLGTCAGVYVLGLCQSRDIPTDGIQLVQKMETTEKGKLIKIGIDIIVPPTFPEKYHKALERAANSCAVKKTILDPPQFKITTIVQ
ncbi:MAG: osmotically inducible protein C [Proteobacteria bacterium]|nr:osmotically inducible protein C [Pseudomonadota bacterium]